jgi:hypothetical protein
MTKIVHIFTDGSGTNRLSNSTLINRNKNSYFELM